MARGGYRPGAGRPKGRKKQRHFEREPDPAPVVEKEIVPEPSATASAEVEEKTPLEYMLSVMNDLAADKDRRDRMAIAAAPFVHRKHAEAGKKESAAQDANSAASGAFKPSEPPKGPQQLRLVNF